MLLNRGMHKLLRKQLLVSILFSRIILKLQVKRHTFSTNFHTCHRIIHAGGLCNSKPREYPYLSGSNQALSYFVSLWKKDLPHICWFNSSGVARLAPKCSRVMCYFRAICSISSICGHRAHNIIMWRVSITYILSFGISLSRAIALRQPLESNDNLYFNTLLYHQDQNDFLLSVPYAVCGARSRRERSREVRWTVKTRRSKNSPCYTFLS
jgi:hypothetical protein